MSATETYVTADDGVRLFVQKVGSGPTAVMIPNAIYMIEYFSHLADGRTLLFFDLRNRGRSETVTDASKLAQGVHHDVEDMEAIRRHFGFNQVDLIGHSYQGLVIMLYAMKYPGHVNRLVQIGPVQPDQRTQYPAHLTNTDAVATEFFAKITQLFSQPGAPEELCRKFWALLRVFQVGDPADADKLHWEPCGVPNELNFMGHWMANLLPSIQKLELTTADFTKVTAPVLTIHGRKDRSSPYGSGREWAARLPDARLLSIDNAAHVPWIEAPEAVFGSIATFLNGAWPAAAEKILPD